MAMGGREASGNVYSFSSQPKAVSGTRKKYREPGETDTTMYRDLKETCITWDKRVHRGNTYGMYTQNAINEAFQNAVQGPPGPEKRRKRKPPEPSPFDMPLPEKEKLAVDLTKHLTAEEKVIVLETVEAQTDEFLPEVPPAQYEPQKTGVDVQTQVEDGELFIFDREVEPILDVLVNKTLEQSLMEVEEEYEMERMSEFKVEWFDRQEAMMKDWQAQVAQEWVRWQKKEAVVKRKREVKLREAKVLLKIQALAAAKKELERIVPNAIEDLAPVAFPDKKAMAIDRFFLPQLLGRVHTEVHAKVQSHSNVNQVVASAVRDRFVREQQNVDAQAERAAVFATAHREEQEIRLGRLRVFVDDPSGEKLAVGPVQISSDEDISAVHDKIFKWLQENMAELANEWQYGVMLMLDGVPMQATAAIFTAMPGQISLVPKPPPPPPNENEGEEGGEAQEGEAQEGEP